MGEFRFRLPADWQLTSRQATSIHIVGIEGIPWPVRVSTENADSVIVIRRNRDESGKLFISFPFPEYGELAVCTGSLPEREAHYDLLTELARGNLNRLRTQVSVWQEGGLKIKDEIHQKAMQATALLGDSILAADLEQRDELARQSLILSMKVMFDLAHDFGVQVCAFRVNHPDFTRFWIGFDAGSPTACDIEAVEELSRKPCFDLVEVEPSWLTGESAQSGELMRAIESAGQRLIVGPLLDASPGGMKADLIDLDDFEARRSKMLAGCRTVLASLPNTTSLLHIACGLNGMGHRHLSYPQQLQLTSDLLQLVEDCSIEVPNVLSFDFPWAERLATSVGGIHPLQIADTLLRQGLRISYLGMDINLDYWPGGSVVRDPFQWIDLIDVWSQLGLPLIVSLRMPVGIDHDEEETDHGGKRADRLVHQRRSNLTDNMRLDLLRSVLPVVFARPTVHGLILRQLSDEQDARFPGAGIINFNGSAKPVVELVEKANEQYLVNTR